MKKTADTIKKKRELKYKALTKQTEHSHLIRINELRKKLDSKTNIEYTRKANQIERKKNAYLKKKKAEYDRKCKNEILKLQDKPIKPLKKVKLSKEKKRQFAMELAQENARLRDTDKNGDGICISCDQVKHRGEMAGGHGKGRSIKAPICIRPENINAQCHPCNFKMGPLGNRMLKKITEDNYRKNARKRHGDDIIDEIFRITEGYYINSQKYTIKESYLDEMIPDMIEENEKRRREKTFYQPKRKRRDYRTKHFTS